MMPSNFPFFPSFISRPYYNNYRYTRNHTNFNNRPSTNTHFENIQNVSRANSNFENMQSISRANSHFENTQNFSNKNYFKNKDKKKDDSIFEIFGLKLHQDDLLLIGLILFLYTEGVKDEFLFISLILLLLS